MGLVLRSWQEFYYVGLTTKQFRLQLGSRVRGERAAAGKRSESGLFDWALETVLLRVP